LSMPEVILTGYVLLAIVMRREIQDNGENPGGTMWLVFIDVTT